MLFHTWFVSRTPFRNSRSRQLSPSPQLQSVSSSMFVTFERRKMGLFRGRVQAVNESACKQHSYKSLRCLQSLWTHLQEQGIGIQIEKSIWRKTNPSNQITYRFKFRIPFILNRCWLPFQTGSTSRPWLVELTRMAILALAYYPFYKSNRIVRKFVLYSLGTDGEKRLWI